MNAQPSMKASDLCWTNQSFWNILAKGGELSNNKGHQICAHVDARLFKLILHEAIGKYSGLRLKYTA